MPGRKGDEVPYQGQLLLDSPESLIWGVDLKLILKAQDAVSHDDINTP
ncbi:MAG: hypothetical protein AB9903_27235 [Vulcanimicrobiota bacterium]